MNKKINIKFDENNCSYDISYNGFSWINDGRKPFVAVSKNIGDKQKIKNILLKSAKTKSTEYAENKITTYYSDFFLDGEKLPFTIICTAEVVEDAVLFSLKTENETNGQIQGIFFPSGFNSKNKTQDSYHVDPMRQGFILPDGYKKNIFATHYYTTIKRPINSADCYMPLWGRVCDGHSLTAIVETPYDASMFSCYGKRLAFLNSVYWQTSLGKISYERKLRLCFHNDGDYNTIAKTYRSYLMKNNLLVTLDEKIKAIRKCGIDYLCIEDFVNVAHIDGERFLEDILVGELHAVGACCGFNFRFGKGASLGAVELQAFFENRGGCVRICDKIVFRDRALSSSLLRELVENGDLEALLAVGHPYSVYAKVEHGKELGRTIGIPTINQKFPQGKVIPAKGVYITECEIGEDVYPSITNVGVRPTVESDGKINMETHIIGFDGNLYGSHVRVNFYKRLRDERSFSSLDELRAEIEKNILSAISYFK